MVIVNVIGYPFSFEHNGRAFNIQPNVPTQVPDDVPVNSFGGVFRVLIRPQPRQQPPPIVKQEREIVLEDVKVEVKKPVVVKKPLKGVKISQDRRNKILAVVNDPDFKYGYNMIENALKGE